MGKVRQQVFKKTYLLTFFAILALCFLFEYNAESQNIPFQNEGTKGHPKIESVLTQLLEEHTKGGMSVSQGFARDRGIKMDQEGMITVYLLPEAGKTKETIDTEALGAYGGEVVKSGDYVIQARIPLSGLKDIADNIKRVSFIKLPDKPHANVVSEGVNLTGASTYQSSGYYGQNVRVAIIDIGFAGLSSVIANGELPSSVIKIDCTGTSCVTTDFSNECQGEDCYHGTACTEIVHDMAPSAQLYLIKIQDSIDLKYAKDYCVSNSINIISHSLGWFNTNFYDGSCYNDNPVCTANNAYSNGILWVNSTGNYARQHYEAIFSDPDGNGQHNVSSNNECVSIYANAGDIIYVTLTWNAWPATNQDYDLYLFYVGSSGLTRVASSRNLQTGMQPPIEAIRYTVSTSGNFCVSTQKYNAASNHKLELFSFYHDVTPYVSSSSITSPADATGAVAAAAIDWVNWTSGPIEYFCSQGPTTDGRIKPDISAPDGVSTLTYGPTGFFGTSASAPHVAGAAALMLSNNPSSVQQLLDKLTSSAIDMGVNGKDNIYGYGRLNLQGVMQSPLPLIGSLENPSDGQTVSGIITIHGWALDGKGITNVEWFIDGQSAGNIPYGGSRTDVKDAHPDYPNAENSGFGIIWNWSILSPGNHAIKIRPYNQDGNFEDLDATVTVKRFHGDYMTNVNPGTYLLPSCEVTGGGITKYYDIKIQWSNATQGFQITDVIPK